MHESEPLKGLTDDIPAPVDNPDYQLAIIALLMRLYDINLAVLNEMNPQRADGIYEAHSQGNHFNPQLYIPDIQ